MAIQTRATTRIEKLNKVRVYGNSRRKRGYDLFLAISLLLLSAPILIPALLLNMFPTRGRPLFIQRRLGKGGQEFGLLKLRSMRSAVTGEVWHHRTTVGDGRITWVGKILRRTYVDELPQLFNVVLGDMSMIGPRPETPETTAYISTPNPRFKERLAVKPGISGIAQVFFRKPGSDHDLWRRYYYDRVYLIRCSFALDLKLTLLTIIHVVRNKGT
jgi:lipopolysaccharide/colanic/teichoic acid biosynthesis glycosyltransferase